MRILTSIVLLFAACSGALADDAVVARLELASAQQMLSQRIVRAACFVAADVDATKNKEIFDTARAEFVAQMATLRDGDPDRGVPPETDETILSMLNAVDGVWQLMEGKVAASDGVFNKKLVAQTSVQSLSILTQLKDVIGTYRDALIAKAPENTSVIEMFVAAGEQGVLIERGSREACMSFLDINGSMVRPQMQTTVQRFASRAFALAFSSEREGLAAPPTDDIQYVNFQGFQEWSNMEWVFNSAGKGDAKPEDLAQLGVSAGWVGESIARAVAAYGALISAS